MQREAFAPGTLVTQLNGVKQWAIFVSAFKWHPCLINSDDVFPLSFERRSEIELKLCCFVAWLSKRQPPLASATIGQYVSHVRTRHSLWLQGGHFNELIGATRRLSLCVRAITKQRPSKKRTKVPFTYDMLAKYFAANLKAITSPQATAFMDTLTFAVIAIAFYHLCRLSEVTDTKPMSQANLFPIVLGDLRFIDKGGAEIKADHDGVFRRWRLVDHIRCRYPPSKADPFGYNSDLLIPAPGKDALKNGSASATAFSAIRLLLTLYPISSIYHATTPLFRSARALPAGQVTDRSFWAHFKKGCRKAGITYSGLGKHSFRLGGMNRLQDLGASVATICAHGRWASDAWAAYSRRNQLTLMSWQQRMAQAH